MVPNGSDPAESYVLGRTPSQSVTFQHLARSVFEIRAIPGGAARRVLLSPSEDVPHVLEVDVPIAEGTERLAVCLRCPTDWRSTWGLRVGLSEVGADSTNAGDSVLLTPATPEAELAVPAGASSGTILLRAVLALGRVSVAQSPVPNGCPAVALADAGFGRHTRQSSATGSDGSGLWMRHTEPEEAPWWELDLGQTIYLETVHVHWAGDPPSGSLRVSFYPYLGADREPFFFDAAWNESRTLRGQGGPESFCVRSVGRFLRIELTPTKCDSTSRVLALSGVEALGALLVDESLRDSYLRAFSLFSERPLFATRCLGTDGVLGAYEPWSTYGEVWGRVQAFASGLGDLLEGAPPGPKDPATQEARIYVGICAPNQAEWVIADLACVLNGFVVVPLSYTDGTNRLGDIVRRCGIACVITTDEALPQLRDVAERCEGLRSIVVAAARDGTPTHVESDTLCHRFVDVEARSNREHPPGLRRETLVPRSGDELATVLFTSGSTGLPKGAMRTYDACNALLMAFGVVQPAVHLSFQPLSHFSERVYLPALIVHGGQVGFASGSERLFEDLVLLRPTAVSGVPRVFNVLLARYEEALVTARHEHPDEPPEAARDRILGELRGVFGDRVQTVSVGSAPPSEALMSFLVRCFAGCRVTEGYGSTECGTITVDDAIYSGVDLKLVDVPELGFYTSDTPSRGEILVKTSHMISGYLGDPDATRAQFDAEGYFHTGDIGRRGEDGVVHVIGRRKNVVKLAQGEFVAPELIEGILMACPLVEQVYVHANSLQASVVALVVPNRAALAQALVDAGQTNADLTTQGAADVLLIALRAVGRASSLLPFQVPSAVHVELQSLTVERGLTTSSGKIDRAAIEVAYAGVFEALYTRGVAVPLSVLDAVRQAAAAALGRDIATDADLAGQLGVDSLAGVEIVARVQAQLQHEVPLDAWFGASTLEELARRIRSGAGVGSSGAAPAADTQAQADLAIVLGLDADVLAMPAPTGSPTHVLLTGATGFLGVHLLEALLRDTEARVSCIVRGEDDRAASARLRARIDDAELAWDRAWDARLEVVAGDLSIAALGLDADTWQRLADSVDWIVHAGAVVNWIMLYGQLRAPNVLGTIELLRFAASKKPKAFHHVSTISTAPPDGDERSSMPEELALAGGPYASTKWIAERHVRLAAEAGLTTCVYRPAMITGHSERGFSNPEDFVNRYLAGSTQLGLGLDLDDCRLDMTPVDFVARAIVALALAPASRGQTYHLTNLAKSPTWREVAGHLTDNGYPVEPVSYDAFRNALLAQRSNALTPLLSFFPAKGFIMRMGPWPCASTMAALEHLAVPRPPAAADLVRATIGSLHRRGALSSTLSC